MKKLVGKTISVGRKINHIDINWYTFKNGEVVPVEFENDIITKGGELEEVKVLETPVKEKVNLDLNNDGVVDDKDASIAGKVLADVKKTSKSKTKKSKK